MTIDAAAITSLTRAFDRMDACLGMDHEQLATLAVTHLTALGFKRQAAPVVHIPCSCFYGDGSNPLCLLHYPDRRDPGQSRSLGVPC